MHNAKALWYAAKGRVELRDEKVAARDGELLIRAAYSGISRGTERLVFEGRVPPSEFQRMRCPRQEGAFPFPVKYGYALVGTVESGELSGKSVFLLHPHQNLLSAAESELHLVPDGVPARRAVLAANMETALNVVWDSGVSAGDRVTIVGGGVLGLLIASLVAALPGSIATVVDIDPMRGPAAMSLGARFASVEEPPADQDIVIHTSATEAGLHLALKCAGQEARVIEASWYGDRAVSLPLGEAFHARRLAIVSSQVGAIPPARLPRWSYRRRLGTALRLLKNEALDTLITDEIAFADAPAKLPKVFASNAGLMTVINYG
ncbi:MAG: zinc-dependent alcohol dehydrogenase [Candidatus Binataceae bacterium]